MRRRLLWLVAAGLLAGSGAIGAGWLYQRRQLTALQEDLIRAGRQSAGIAVWQPESLPAPVARYFRFALPEAMPIRIVRLRQRGTVRTDLESDRWMPFTADHLVAPAAIGFLWNARVEIAPLLHVRVRDALSGGQGSGKVDLLSAFTISAAGGTPEMNSGALHRFLAEAVWYPTALIPSERLQWSPIDATRALATLRGGDVSVSLEFRFGESGEVTGIYTPGRWGTFDGGYQQRGWEGYFRKYARMSGILVPEEGEVGWYLDGQWQSVWRGTVTAFQIEAR